MTERITGIIDRLADADNYEEVAWLLNAPVENIALSVVDDTMRENAEFQYKAGLPAKVVRTAEPISTRTTTRKTKKGVKTITYKVPCKWCRTQAGTYTYPNVPKDVWRRHLMCECTIEYTPAGGGRVDTLRGRGKAWEQIDPEVLAERKAFVGVDVKPNLTASQNGEMIAELQSVRVEDIPVQTLKKPLNEEKIIERVGGADKTRGSCVSTCHAYIGNKAGYDVLDYRGGESQNFFATRSNTKKIAQFKGVKAYFETNGNDYTAVSRLVKNAEEGKDYMLVTGHHGAIIRKDGGVWRYLEMQGTEEQNGWHNLNNAVLKERFGCTKTHTKFGMKYKPESILIDTETLYDNDAYKELLGYINTNVDDQLKGAGGSAK